MATAQQLAEQQRQAQAQLRAQVVRDILALWRGMANPDDIDAEWPGLRDILARMVLDRRAESAQRAADYYLAARAAAGASGTFSPVLASTVDGDALATALDVTGPVAFKQAIGAGMTPAQALDQAAAALAGAASRIALDGGRATIHRAVADDDEAIGWARLTDADPCAFCAMLASRGPVYKNARTAGDPRAGGDRYHDHCACIAAPVFSRDEAWLGHARDLSDEWERVTAGLSGADARRAWRRHWEAQQRQRRADAAQRAEEERQAAEEAARRAEEERQAAEAARQAAADPLAGVDLTSMSDDEVAAFMSAHGDDPAVLDAVLAEMERRDQAAAQAAGEQWNAPDDEPTDEERRIAELVDQGWDYRDAYVEVHGLDPAELERQERAAVVDAQRADGETRDQAVRRLYDEWVYQQWLAAEAATNGVLLNRAGEAAGVDPRSLFSGPAARARKYASEELKRWWQDNPRMTFTEFRADMLGRESDRQAAARIRAGGTGREFGL